MEKLNNRMTWNEIADKYPDQWVGLTDVEWDNASTVKSAIVKYFDKSKNELLGMQLDGKIQFSCYTTPNDILSVGGLTLL